MSGLSDRLGRVPPQPPPYVLENTTRTHPTRLFRLFAIDWMAYPTAWIAPVWMAVIGILISFASGAGNGAGERVATGLAFAALIAVSILLHYLGGALAGKLLGAPMRFIFFTATLAYCRYDDSRDYPSRVQLTRSLAQPAVHAVLAGVAAALYAGGHTSRFVLFLAILNGVFLAVSMTPLPTMHGGVALKHLRAWKRG